MEQHKSHSRWGRVSNSPDFPLFIEWLEKEEVPSIQSELTSLDVFDKDFTLHYTRLSGELKAYNAIIARYETRTKEQEDG